MAFAEGHEIVVLRPLMWLSWRLLLALYASERHAEERLGPSS